MMNKLNQGSVLLFTLIILAVLLFSISASMNTTTKSTIVTGNLNFKRTAIKEADIGLYSGVKSLAPCGTDPCNKVLDSDYISYEQIAQDFFLNSKNWREGNDYVHTISEENDRYKIQYIIDRLSDENLETDYYDPDKVKAHSYGIIIEDSRGSNDASDGSDVIKVPVVFYRITVRVEGPRNTLYMTQAIVTVTND